MTKKFHLGWFMNFIPPEWDTDYTSPDVASWANGDFYVDMARSMERACFDFMMIEDTVMVADAYGGTMEGSLKNSVFAPKHDPLPLAIKVASNTSKIGVVATLSTSFYPPYLLARACSTADSIAGGRFGWNIVSSAEDRAAQNFGLDRLYEHDERYNMADEYFELVNQLWDSWEPDAVVMDRETHTYADFRKVHTIDFAGKYFKSRGPLNTIPLAAAQADDPAGRRLAAGPRVRREGRRRDRRGGDRHPGHEGVPRRHPPPRRGDGPRPRRHQADVLRLADRRRHRGRRRRQRSSGSPTTTCTSASAWSRSPRTPRSTSPCSRSTSRCPRG